MTLTYPDPVLTDGVVRLRRWRLDDLGCIRAASDDPVIPRGTTVPVAWSDEAGRGFIERQWRRHREGEGVSLAVADAASDEARGLAVLLHRPQPAVVGIGYWVVPAARRRGLATRAVSLLSSWALDDVGMARVEAWVEPGNLASQRVLAHAGFAREGLLRSFLQIGGRRCDVVVHSRIAARG